mgnify:FL=1
MLHINRRRLRTMAGGASAKTLIAACERQKQLSTKKVKIQDTSAASEVTAVEKAHADATAMIDKAINRLEAAKKHPDALVASRFGIAGTTSGDIARLDALISNYQKMQTGAAGATYEVEHEAIKAGEPYTVAYVYTLPVVGGVGDIHINFPAFSLGSDADRAATVVHEMSHYYAGTDDVAYEWEPTWSTMNPEVQSNNADSYSSFARDS